MIEQLEGDISTAKFTETRLHVPNSDEFIDKLLERMSTIKSNYDTLKKKLIPEAEVKIESV